MEHAKVNRLLVPALREDPALEKVMLVRPRGHGTGQVALGQGVQDDPAPAITHPWLDHKRRSQGGPVRL